MNDNPISMPNAKLALGMVTAGIPFAEPEDGGPALNYYTPGLLRDRRLIGQQGIGPIEFELKVIETAERGIAGSVVYFFQRTREAENFIEAWDKISDTIRRIREWETLTDAERAELDPPPKIPDIPIEVIAQVLCIHANNEERAKKLPFVNAPICNAVAGKSSPGKETATGVMAGVTEGAGQTWSTNLNDADRAKIGLRHKKIRDWKPKL